MIQLKNIVKSYGNLEVLKDVSLEIYDGEILAIVGPSGAGKTTLLQIAGTLDCADRGRVVYDDEEVTTLNDKKLSKFRSANIGFVFQFHQLLAEFTATENVALAAMIAGVSKRNATERAKELLTQLGLGDRLNHKPSQLSGGECQRVAFARALINGPKVVFADEPTGSLDSRNRDDIELLIKDLRQRFGQTFVLVTHDESVAKIADRIVRMEDGRIVSVELPIVDDVENQEDANTEDGCDE